MKTSLLTLSFLLLFAATDSLAEVLRAGSWSSSGSEPHSTLTEALAVAKPGDDIWVVQGIYREAELTIPAGVSVYGGFTGSETSLSERNYATNVTILDGSGAHRVATVSGLLDGFTLRNGRTGDNGGGVIVKSGGVLSHCIAFANEAGYDGGGVYAEEDGVIKNTLLTGNRAGNDGAAISGARGFNAMNITAADNTFTGIPVIDALSGVPASLQAGGVLDVTPPAISDDGGSTVLMKGWELDGNAISMPYTVTYADNGKKLRYWAANAVGVGVSTEVALTVTWTVTSSVRLITPKAVCEGTTLADAGISDPVVSPAPADGTTYTYYIDGTAISGLGYQLQYSDNGKLLTCEIKNHDGSIVGATTPEVRLAVMKAPDVLLTPAPLSAEDGERLCLPAPVVLSNGSDVTAQGWQWKKGADGGDFTSCDVVDKATLDGATLYYTATNACSATPVSLDYGVLSVAEAVGEFSLKLDEICAGTRLADAIGFADGNRADGIYTIGGTKIEFNTHVLTEADNLKQLRYTFNGSKNERRLTLTVHSVPTIQTQPVTPADAICKGSGHSLNVVVSGENLRYQWEESADHGTTWLPVAGATDSYLRLNVENDRQYHCTVTGVCISEATGYDDVKKQIVSSAAAIAVTDRPVIGLPTVSDFDICEQATLGSILTASGVLIDGVAAVPDNGTQGWTLGGIKVLTTYPVTASDDGKVLGYWASNGCGESTRTFDGAVLAVSKKVSILQPPTDVSVNEGSKVRLSVLTGNTAGTVTYQWFEKTAGGEVAVIDGPTSAGGQTATYTFDAPLLTADEAAAGESITQTYFCRITSTNACDGDAPTDTDPVTVTILRTSTAVDITAQPSGYDICAGEAMKALSVTAKGRGMLSYQWYRNGRKAVEGTGAGQDGVGATSASFTPNTGGTYYCLVTSSDNAQGLRSEEAIVTVHQVPAINVPLATAFSTCKGSTISLQFVVGAGSDGVTYKWYDKAHAGTVLSTDSRLSVAASSTATYVVEATPEWCADKVAGGVNLKPEVVVTVTDVPAITGGPTAQVTRCENTFIGTLTTPTITDNGSAVISQSWTLNGINIDPTTYKVSSADHGKVLGYRVRNACGETVVTFDAATLNIEKRPQLLQVPVDVTTEENNQVRLSVLTAENNVTYAWYKEGIAAAIAGADKSTYAYTPAVLTGGDLTNGERTEKYYCVITTTTSMCKGNNADATPETSADAAFEKSSSATVTIRRKTTDITIEAQPDAFPEACDGFIDKVNEGATGGIRVTATGRGPLTFRWYKNGKAVVAGDGTAVESAGTTLPADPDNALAPTLRQTSAFTPTAAGTYYCLVTSADNTTGVRSEQSVLTVHGIPAITEDLTDLARTLCADSELSLRIAATGSNRTYQWQKKTGAAFTNIAGETDVRLRTTVDGNATYRCVVTATCKDGKPADEATLNSAEVVVTMSQKPAVTLAATASPITQCEAAAITLPTGNLTVNNNHSTIPADGQWWTLGGQKVAAGYLLKTADNGKSLGYRAANSCGETVVTFPVTVQVDDNPVIVQDPQDAEVQMGSNVRLSVRATGSGTLAYQWQKKAVGDADFTAVTDGGTVSGATNNTLSFIAAAITDITVNEVKTQYRCIVTTNNVCGSSATSLASTVTVQRTKSNISILRQPQGYEICSGSRYRNLTVEVSGTGEFYYEWYQSDGTVVKAKAGASTTNTTDSYLPTAAGTFYCVVTSTDDATGVRTQQALVTEYQTPVNVTVSPDNTSVCEGNTVTLGVSMAAGDSPMYQWYSKTAAGGGSTGGTVCTGATSSTFTPLNLTASADGTANDYYYYCEVKSKYCPDTKVASSLAAVKVNRSPKISVQPQSQTICDGSAAPLTITAATDKANGYTWYLNGVAQAGTSNSFNATKAGVYTCEVSSQQCGSVLSAPALITVASIPSIKLAATDGGDLTACKGDMVVLPSPLIDAKGSVILTDKSGWHTAAAPAKLVSSYVVSKEETWTYKLMYKCSEGDLNELTYAGTIPTLTVKMTPVPTLTGSLKAETLTLNAGDQVTETTGTNALLTAVLTVTGATGAEWLLGGTPVTLPYTVSAADNGKAFEVRARNVCGEEVYLIKGGNRAKTTLTVNSLVITTQPVSQTYCEGVTGKKLSVATNITAGVTHQWYKDGDKINANGTGKEYILGNTTAAAGVYTCEVKLGTLTVVSSPAVISVNAKPAVVSNSQNITVCKGSPVTLQVEAKGHDLQYSWDQGIASTSSAATVSPTVTTTYTCTVKNSCNTTGEPSKITVTVTAAPTVTGTLKDVTKNTGEAVSEADVVTSLAVKDGTRQWLLGGTPVSLPYTTTSADHGKLFTCEVTNTCGDKATLSAATGKLTVNSLVITTQPVSQTYCEGETGKKLSVVTNITAGVTYQWYKDGAKITVNGTGKDYALGNTTAAAGVYTCEVKLGTLTVVSSPAVISVNAKPAVVSNSQSVTVCKGSPVTLQVEAKGYDLEYSWDQGISSTSSAATVSPAATTTYTCTVKNSCKTTGETSKITVTVNSPVAITKQPKDQNECSYAALNVVAGGTPVPSYKWYINGVAAATGDIDKPAEKDATPKKDGVYTCEVSNACGSVMSSAAVVKKAVALGGGVITADRTTVCPGESATLNIKDVTGDAPAYVWRSGNATTGAVVGNAATLTVNPTATTTYYCTVSNACGSLAAKSQAITVTSAPAITGVLKAVTKKEGESVAQADLQTTAPASAGNTLTWTLDETPVKFGYKVSTADDGKVFKVTATNSCGQSATLGSSSTLTVLSAPQIVEQPRGTTLCEGTGSVVLSVKAAGSGLSYQWMIDGADVTNAAGTGGNDVVAGATDATLTLTKPAAGRSGVYTCKVSGTGGDAVVSAPAVVTVNANVAITSQPKAVAICQGGSAALQVEASGAKAYQWKTGATDISGAQSASLTVTSAGTYQCVVTGVCGTATSLAVAVTVNSPVKITKQPLSEVKCASDAFTALSVAVSGISPQYQWYQSGTTVGGNSSSHAPGQTAGSYYCVASNACGSETSATAVLTRHPALVVSAVAASVSFNEGSTAAIGVNVTAGSPVKYSWNNGAGTAASASVGTAGTYTCTVTDVCGKTATASVTVSMKAAAEITAQPSGATLCEEDNLTLTLTATNSAGFAWYCDGKKLANSTGNPASDKVEGATAATLKITKAAVSRSGVYVCHVTGADGKVAASQPAVVTVNGKVSVVSDPKAVAICAGNAATLQIEAVGASSYSWTKDAETAVLSKAASLTVTAAGTYKCTVAGCGSSSVAKTAVVTVNNPVKITKQPVSYTACTYSALSVAATGTGLGYQWYKADGGAVGTAGSTSYTPTADGSYYCVVTSTCGSETSAPAVVKKTVALGGGTLGADRTTVCPGESATLTMKDVTGDAPQYVWCSGNATTGVVVGNAATLTVNPTATTTYYCTVSNACGSLAAKSQAITVTGAPATPTFATGTSAATCEGNEVTLPGVTNKAAKGRWELDGVAKGNITKYKVHLADQGQVFRYVNINDCGAESAPSADTYTLTVKQPARIKEQLAWGVMMKSGDKLNTKFSTPPAADHVTSSKWTLNGSTVALTDAVAVTDDAGRLSYSVDNGCPAGVGVRGDDETHTMIRVWGPPTFRGDGTETMMAAKVGTKYTYPALPIVHTNNCRVISEGWIIEGTAQNSDGYLDLNKVAELSEVGKKVMYRVQYTGEDGVTAYADSRVMGVMQPWDVPTLSAEKTGKICQREGSAYKCRVTASNMHNTTFAGGTYQVNGLNKSDEPPLAEQSDQGKTLSYTMTYIAPDGTSEHVSIEIGSLHPYAKTVTYIAGKNGNWTLDCGYGLTSRGQVYSNSTYWGANCGKNYYSGMISDLYINVYDANETRVGGITGWRLISFDTTEQ